GRVCRRAGARGDPVLRAGAGHRPGLRRPDRPGGADAHHVGAGVPRRDLHPVRPPAARHAGHRQGPAQLPPGATRLERGRRPPAGHGARAGPRRLGGGPRPDRGLALAPGEHYRLSAPGMMVNMRLTSRGKPGPESGPDAGDDLDTGVTGLLRYRRLVIRALAVIFLLLPAAPLLRSHPLNARDLFLILGTLACVVLVDPRVLGPTPEPGRCARWPWGPLPIPGAMRRGSGYCCRSRSRWARRCSPWGTWAGSPRSPSPPRRWGASRRTAGRPSSAWCAAPGSRWRSAPRPASAPATRSSPAPW